MANLPTITKKQSEILILLYRFRFLNRQQIQSFLNHKDKRRTSRWLKDLKEKQYIDWFYDANDFANKTKPAIYYLAINGIRYLRESGTFPDKELRKRYKESARSRLFIDRCLLIADCCIALKAKCSSKLQYTYVLPADYSDQNSDNQFLDELKPQLYFSKQDDNKTTDYLLESFELTLPRFQLRKRIDNYIEYLANENDGQLIALLICPNIAELLYVKRRVRTVIGEDYSEGKIKIRVTTLDKIKASNVTGLIWEDI